MVKKAIFKMNFGKDAGPLGVVMEMIRAAGDTRATMIRGLPKQSFEMGRSQPTGGRASLSAFTRKRVMLGPSNYRGLKLTEQAMKVIERIAYSLIRQVMTIDWSTLGGPLCR